MSDTASREWRFYIDDMICQPVLDNRDLPIDFVRELLIAPAEDPAPSRTSRKSASFAVVIRRAMSSGSSKAMMCSLGMGLP